MYETLAYANQLLDALIENRLKADMIRKLTAAVADALDNCVVLVGPDYDEPICSGDNPKAFDEELLTIGQELRYETVIRVECVESQERFRLYTDIDAIREKKLSSSAS